MIAPDPSKANETRAAPDESSVSPDLPFRIDLWDAQGSEVERVVARAHTPNLAQAIFKAASEQYPGRRLTLWRGRERIAESG